LSFIDEISRDSSFACSASPASIAEIRLRKWEFCNRLGVLGIDIAVEDGVTVGVGVGVGAGVGVGVGVNAVMVTEGTVVAVDLPLRP
jgi:hypothetical protein